MDENEINEFEELENEFEENADDEYDEFPEIFSIEITDEVLKRMNETAIPFNTDEEDAEV